MYLPRTYANFLKATFIASKLECIIFCNSLQLHSTQNRTKMTKDRSITLTLSRADNRMSVAILCHRAVEFCSCHIDITSAQAVTGNFKRQGNGYLLFS